MDQMERPRIIGSPRKLQTNLLCIPKLKTPKNSSNNSSPNKAARGGNHSPMTALLERLREAVFRLIMLSALSSSPPSRGAHHHHHVYNSPASKSYDHNDHRHSEAVADCIEFIKKKAGPDEMSGPDFRGSCSSRDSAVSEPALEEMCHNYV